MWSVSVKRVLKWSGTAREAGVWSGSVKRVIMWSGCLCEAGSWSGCVKFIHNMLHNGSKSAGFIPHAPTRNWRNAHVRKLCRPVDSNIARTNQLTWSGCLCETGPWSGFVKRVCEAGSGPVKRVFMRSGFVIWVCEAGINVKRPVKRVCEGLSAWNETHSA